jgi:hypothetical protein
MVRSIHNGLSLVDAYSECILIDCIIFAGVVKYGNSILVVGGEDDKSWMAGICSLQIEDGKHQWMEGEPLPTVMSTFGCIVATLPRESMCQDISM